MNKNHDTKNIVNYVQHQKRLYMKSIIKKTFFGCVLLTFFSMLATFLILPLVRIFVENVMHEVYHPMSFFSVWLVLSILTAFAIRITGSYNCVTQTSPSDMADSVKYACQIMYKQPGMNLDNIGIHLSFPDNDSLMNHGKVYSRSEITAEIKRLCDYVLGDGRNVEFFNNQLFPSMIKDGETEGKLKYCTYKEFVFGRFVRRYLKPYSENKYLFFDVDYFLDHVTNDNMEDYNICESKIDDVLSL